MSDHESTPGGEDEREARPSAALQGMIDEVRSSAPTVDWARLEARLFDADGNLQEQSGVQRISGDGARADGVTEPPAASTSAEPPVGSLRRPRLAAIAVSLALAASFTLALVTPTGAPGPTAAAPEAGASAAPLAASAAERAPLLLDDGGAVAIGRRIDAPEGAWLRSKGRVSVHLEPGTVATVLDLGERVHLSLEAGAIAADVVPVAGGEPFAVDAAGHRVAVHGTRLRVALLGPGASPQGVQVAVSEGSAVVGVPRSLGRTEGTLVHVGHVGRFDAPGTPGILAADAPLATALVDGSLAPKAATAALHPPPRPPTGKPSPAAIGAATALAAANVGSAAHSSATAPSAQGLDASQLSGPLARLAPSLQTCARKSSAGVVFTYAQTLTLEIAPSGKATLLAADPGLDTGDRACWSQVVSAQSFPKADRPTTVQHRVTVGSP
jgi:ferric-dicitrate binding protein FerR (iron transport regulator)